MKTQSPDLTDLDFASLCVRGARVYYRRASLQVKRVPTPWKAEGTTESRFVMEGPSGRHSLLVDATDLERLNAHWRTFAADPRNAFA